MSSMSRLMPNLRGFAERKRKLYANVVLSVALYGTPIWADALVASKRNTAVLQRVQRVCHPGYLGLPLCVARYCLSTC